jgi:hypothetical protein
MYLIENYPYIIENFNKNNSLKNKTYIYSPPRFLLFMNKDNFSIDDV